MTDVNHGTDRNDGIDLLRIVSMYMITILHVCGQGGAMVRIASHPATYYACWLLETMCMCAVNCYGLISGYVGVKSTFRPWKILLLWLQVWFWSVLIFLGLSSFHPEWVTPEIARKVFFPASFKTYWYFSAYAALFFLTPFINRGIAALTKKMRCGLMLALFLVFSVWTMVPKAFSADFLSLVGGYSFVWIFLLYVWGACLRENETQAPKKRTCLLMYFSMVLLAWIYKILMENATRSMFGEARYGRVFVTYTAPTMVICGFCLFFFFRELSLRKTVSKLIRRLSGAAFGVYIIHTHPLIWENILKNAFSYLRYMKTPLVIAPVMLAAAGIFAACMLLEQARMVLFRVCRIRELCVLAGEKLEKGFARVVDRMC